MLLAKGVLLLLLCEMMTGYYCGNAYSNATSIRYQYTDPKMYASINKTAKRDGDGMIDGSPS